MKLSQKVFKALLIFFVLWSFAGTVLADGSVGSFTIPNPLSCGDLGSCVDKVLRDLLLLATPNVAVMVIIGGYQILTAGGEPEKFSRGKKTIIYAAVGFAIILLANGVVYIIQDVFNGGGVVQCNLANEPGGPCNTSSGSAECNFDTGEWQCS